MKYELFDYELKEETVIEAPGVAEAMLEYLPWPTIDLKIYFEPAHGRCTVIDIVTDFKYQLQII